MENINKQSLWRDTLENIKVSVSSASFTTWFAQSHLVSLKKNDKRYLAEVGCGSSYSKSTLEKRYFGIIQDNLSKSLEAPVDVMFVVKQLSKTKKDTSPSPLFQERSKGSENLKVMLQISNLRFGFTFDNYAVSSSNQMAWAAADAVSKTPGNAYNPLFIWGGVGVGKTHLMNAVGYAILENDDEKKILFCSGEEFTNDIVEGIRHKTTQKFRNKYRKLDALFVDDIQFIAGKDAVQEEFFHTFNALAKNKGQIILTSDQPPGDMSKLEERLRSRFEAGLTVDIANPDFELRCAITQIKSKERGIEIPMDLIQLIAGNIDGARQIEGFLVRLSSEAKLKNVEVGEELIEAILFKGARSDGPTLKANPNDLIGAVSKYFSIGKRMLLGSSRARPISHPRQVLMYLLRTELGLPLQEVGRLVGRDHTTVMHAVDKITHLASSDVQIRSDIRGIKNLV